MEKYKEYCDIHNLLEIFLQKTKLSEEEIINSVFYEIKDFIENIISRYELDSDSSLSKKRLEILKGILEEEGILREIIESLNQILLQHQKNIYYLLKNCLNRSPKIDWEKIIEKFQKQIPEPEKPKEPDYPSLPPEPKFWSLCKKLFPIWEPKKLKEWHKKCEEIKKEIENLRNNYQRKLAQWERKQKEWERKQKEIVNKILNVKKSFHNGEPWAVEKYFQWVIEASKYPWEFQKNFELFFNKENKILLVEFILPKPEDLPQIKEIKYIKTRGKIQIIYFKEKELAKLYDCLIYQIVLKTIYELFKADTEGYLSSIVFNGRVNTIDKRTGRPIKPCIVSIHTKKETFFEINIESVDPKECFRYLKGIGSSKLHLLTPVPPIMQITKYDERFTEGYSVIDNVHEGYNLATMDWLDFENLVRELFEKEFAKANGEVKITRASRDRGVDAVVFDPDPIRGGKIILQAKRYTNNVDVSAVRDLYGTVVNEGATKGILITTSDFGSDAYEFAKNKPITLINGAGLLYLLEKHGYKAYINLEEAKNELKKQKKE